MTQTELAHRLGFSPEALTRIMKGRQNLSIQTFQKLEEELGIHLVTVL